MCDLQSIFGFIVFTPLVRFVSGVNTSLKRIKFEDANLKLTFVEFLDTKIEMYLLE